MSDEEIAKKDDIVKNYRAASLEELCDSIDKKFEDKIKVLKEETENAFTIDESNLSAELTKTIYKLHTYLTKFTEEKMLLSKIERKRKDIHAEVYGQLTKGEQMRFGSKGEVEEWVNRNPKWIKITTYYDNQEIICDYYKGILDILGQKQWALRTKTDLKKIELGI